ncbi:MAG: hypothetical protein U0736_15695 [Gemmataceae bacterium]
MQTVNFQCGHCSNLMAVSVDYLGQQVRCPHCQQVVLAPANAAPPQPVSPPAAPEVEFKGLAQSEDIFHQPSDTEDALFGHEEAPKVHMPDPHSAPHLNSAPSPVAANGSSAVTDHAPAPAADSPVAAGGNLPWMTSAASSEPSAPAGEADTPLGGSSALGTIRRHREAGKGVDWFVPLVFVPVVVYAVLATAAAGYMYVKMKTAPKSLFEQMPDEGDTPGVNRKTRVFLNFDKKTAMQPLPPQLIVPLGKSLVVGDLEVTPKKVERRKVSIFTEGAEERPEPSPFDALVLHLHLKNLAKDYAYTPVDNYFDRRWKPTDGGSPPLTMLMAGPAVFFGGPARWYPMQRDTRKGTRRDWLEGRKNIDRQGLAPGAETDTYVSTDGWDPTIQETLFGLDADGRRVKKPYDGSLLWRVQLRRGLVEYNGKEVPATSVVGVEFATRDYASKGS